MLPADVGAAPAASTRYQIAGTTTPGASARQGRPTSDADPFGELVDHFADDSGAAAQGGRPVARAAARPAAPAPPQQPLAVPGEPVLESSPVKPRSAPLLDEVVVAVATSATSTESGRLDLLVLPTPAPIQTAVVRPPAPSPGPAVPTGAPVASATFQHPTEPASQALAVSPAAAQAQPQPAQGPEFASAGDVEAEPLVGLDLMEQAPAEAASDEVLAAVRAAREAQASGVQQGLGATVSAAASTRAVRDSQPVAASSSSNPRDVATAAVRAALSRSAEVPRPRAATHTTPDAEPVPDPAPVSPERVIAAKARPADIGRAAQVAVSTTEVAADVTPAAAPIVGAVGADGTDAESVTPSAPTDEGSSVRATRSVRQPQSNVPTLVSGEALPVDEAEDETAVSAASRKADPDPRPVASPRPTARAAHAIAAFHAAAAIGSAATPAAVHASVVGATAAAPLLDTELPTQLIHAIRVQFEQGSGEARIRLNPGFLGDMTVGIRVDGASVTASLAAANPEVREWMRTNEAMLRQALADQGLQLDRLVIVEEDAPASSDDGGQRSKGEREEEAPRRQRRTADQGTFEVVF